MIEDSIKCFFKHIEKEEKKEIPLNVRYQLFQEDLSETELRITSSMNLRVSLMNMKKFPENLIIEGDFFIGSSMLEELPDNLTVLGALSCSMSRITKLPRRLKVKGLVFMRNMVYQELFPIEYIRERIPDAQGYLIDPNIEADILH
jgi:hypothetical protein